MRIGIVGYRGYHDFSAFCAALEHCLSQHNLRLTHIISGGASGVDTLAERYARTHTIPITIYPANWDKYGARAGPIRNKKIVKHSKHIIAFLSPLSKGTQVTIDLARAAGVPVTVIPILT